MLNSALRHLQRGSSAPVSRLAKESCLRAMASDTKPPTYASRPISLDRKKQLISELIDAKEATGKTFTQISREVGLTNAQTAQLFYNQAMLKADRVDALRKAVPGLTDEHVSVMQRCPMRSFDPLLLQEPHCYRMYEAVVHYAEAVKAIMNEEAGDGIMSAIDMYGDVQIIKGKGGEARVCLTFNGKFLPHIEQRSEDNTAPKETK